MYYLVFTAGEENELFDLMFSDLKGKENIRMISGVPRVRAPWKGLYAVHHARSLNRRQPAPFRGIWSDRGMEELLKEEVQKHEKLCLVFNNFSLPYFEPSQLKKWKKKYGVKLVLCFIDRMSSYFAGVARMYADNVDFDLLYSYYRRDAQAYGYRYFDTYYSAQSLPGVEQRQDVFFWGSDTGRREMLESVYRRMSELGKSVCMGICYAQGGAPYTEGIVYDKPRSYSQMLQGIADADVLLDVIAGEGGVSLRYHEALVYGKKLLSNNPEVKNMRMYNEDQVLYFEKAEDIGEEFFAKKICPPVYGGQFSPLHWIEELETYLS